MVLRVFTFSASECLFVLHILICASTPITCTYLRCYLEIVLTSVDFSNLDGVVCFSFSFLSPQRPSKKMSNHNRTPIWYLKGPLATSKWHASLLIAKYLLKCLHAVAHIPWVWKIVATEILCYSAPCKNITNHDECMQGWTQSRLLLETKGDRTPTQDFGGLMWESQLYLFTVNWLGVLSTQWSPWLQTTENTLACFEIGN